MLYLYNYVADVVVRQDEEGNRFLKSLGNLQERKASKDCKEAWGIPSYGIYNILTGISKEQYETFGLEWDEITP